MHPPKKDVLPELLVPAISKLLEPSIRNHISPAEKGSIILVLTNKGKVHGLSLCLLKAKAKPSGDNDLVIAATLALPPGTINSVSRTGLASSNGLPDCRRNRVAHDSASSKLGTIFVSHSK